MRYIFHVDVNSAFLSWSAVYRLRELGQTQDLRSIPSVIGGDEEARHGIVLAKSTPAKKYGIETAEPIAMARRKCPGLVVVPSDFEVYRRYSKAFMDILNKYSDNVIQYSIDEAWVVFDGYEDVYGDMVEFAYKLKDEIKDTLGFTVNIGVSTQFILAKMAGDFEKPDKVHTLFEDERKEKMWPLPVSDLLYAGKAMTKSLRTLGILTIGDLAHADLSVIESNLGKFGVALWEYANGADIEPEDKEEMTRKGYGKSTTTPTDTVDMETARRILLQLSDDVAARLRRDKVYAGCISVSVRYSDFTHIGKQMIVDTPTSNTTDIYATACKLINAIWDGHTPVRQLGVRATKVTNERYEQLSIWDMDNSAVGIEKDTADVSINAKREKADRAMDILREKMGKDIVKRGM
ncbi:MAG: DNA polymerase IV [Lachnospiraceae bacterium]|nr:DNA polymerase IV [Candidatus Colinaster equi]